MELACLAPELVFLTDCGRAFLFFFYRLKGGRRLVVGEVCRGLGGGRGKVAGGGAEVLRKKNPQKTHQTFEEIYCTLK